MPWQCRTNPHLGAIGALTLGREARRDEQQRDAQQQEGREGEQQVYCPEEQRDALLAGERRLLPPQVVRPPVQGGQRLRVHKGRRQRLANEVTDAWLIVCRLCAA